MNDADTLSVDSSFAKMDHLTAVMKSSERARRGNQGMKSSLKLQREMLTAVCLAGSVATATAGSYSQIYDFADPTHQADSLIGPQLLLGSGQTLYGEENLVYRSDKEGFGVSDDLFRLTPPPAGQTSWVHTILYDAASVYGTGSLLMGGAGTIYGSYSGGTYPDQNSGPGYIVQYTPPQSGSGTWTRSLVYQFAGAGLAYPNIRFVKNGEFFGDDGTNIFKLSPPKPGQSTYSLSILYKPTGAKPPIIESATPAIDGSLFGTALTANPANFNSYDTTAIWRLTPPSAPGSAWSFRVVNTILPNSDVGSSPGNPVLDRSLRLYDTNRATPKDGELGTVFRVSPPASGQTTWHHDLLYAFQGKSDSGSPTALVESPDGRLYGVSQCPVEYDIPNRCPGISTDTTITVDTLFRLTPRDYGGLTLPWNLQVLHTFNIFTTFAGGADPEILIKGTTPDGKFEVFGVAKTGGANGLGSIFRYIP